MNQLKSYNMIGFWHLLKWQVVNFIVLKYSLFGNCLYSIYGMSTSTDLPLLVLRRNSEGSKPTPKITLPWTTTNLVYEALHVNLHVLEDDRMTSWLQRKFFVELCIHGTNGWQDGVSLLTFTFNLYSLQCSLIIWCPSTLSIYVLLIVFIIFPFQSLLNVNDRIPLCVFGTSVCRGW